MSSNKLAQHKLDDHFTPHEDIAKAGGDQKSEEQVTVGDLIYAKGPRASPVGPMMRCGLQGKSSQTVRSGIYKAQQAGR